MFLYMLSKGEFKKALEESEDRNLGRETALLRAYLEFLYRGYVSQDRSPSGLGLRLFNLLREWELAESESYRQRIQHEVGRIVSQIEGGGEEGNEDSVMRFAAGTVAAQMLWYDKSKHLLSGALDTKTVPEELVPYIYYTLGELEINFQNLVKGKKQFKKALKLFIRNKNLAMTALTRFVLGSVHLDSQKYSLAITELEQAESLFKKTGNEMGVGKALPRLGLAKAHQGSRSGISDIKKGIRILKDSRSRAREDWIMAHVYLIETYFLAGKKRKGKKGLMKLITSEPVKQYPGCYNRLSEVVKGEDWLKRDKETAFLFESRKRRSVKMHVLEEVIRLARESHPLEFGALLMGRDHIEGLSFVPNTTRGKKSVMFQLYYNPFGHERVEGDGVVHSHPSGSARPSPADLAMFSRFPGINIILAYPYTMDSWAAYDSLGNRVELEVRE